METKQPLSSKTVIGIVIAALPDVANWLAEIEGAGVIPEKYAPLVRTIGLGLAVIGRWTARLPLGFNLKW
jgi:hypothetical protein